MADFMEVDASATSAPAASSLPPLPDLPPAASDPLLLLRHALQPFIRLHLSRALGPDMLPLFAPAPNATLPSLLRFLQSKWIGVFSDTSLGPCKTDIERLAKLLQRNADDTDQGKRKVDKIAQALLHVIGKSSLAARIPSSHSAREPKLPLPHAGGLHLVSGAPHVRLSAAELLPVVLDGANIAWRHGGSHFSLRGAAEALHYYSTRGHATVLFLPEARLSRCDREEDRPLFDAVNALAGGQSLVKTPESDYDDSYICHFARRYGAVVVSNDAFKDQVYQATAEGEDEAKGWEKWFAACRVSFTFRSDLFIPNPAFNYQKAAVVAKELALKE